MTARATPVNLKEAVRHLDALPAMPVIAQKILALDLQSDAGERALLKLIEQDPQIAAKIIGLANTPLFGSSKSITSIADAAMLLGITRVKSVTLGIAVMSALVKKSAGKLDIQGLWLHNLAIALALRTLARAMPANIRPLDDQLFLAGLLHDIGYVVLNHLDQPRSDELHSRFAAESERDSYEIEAELLEMNHCELGAELARFWNLPDMIVAVLRYHHTPDNASASFAQPLVRMTSLAGKILSTFGISEHIASAITAAEWEALEIDPARADELIAQITAQAEEARQTAGMLP